MNTVKNLDNTDSNSAKQSAPLEAPHLHGTSAVRTIKQLSEEFWNYVLGTPSKPPAIPSKPETQRAQELSTEEIMTSIRRTSLAFAKLTGFTELFNTLGAREADKDMGVAAVMMPLALYDVHQRVKLAASGTAVKVSQGEELFLKIYRASHNDALDVPEWFFTAAPFVDLSSKMEHLPGIQTYVEESRSMAAEARALTEKLENLAIRQTDALQKADRLDAAENGNLVEKGAKFRPSAAGNAERVRAGELKTEMRDIEANMLAKVDKIKDVRPELVSECINELQVSTGFKPALVRTALELTKTIAELIALSTNEEYREKRGMFSLSLPELIFADGVGSVSSYKFSAAALQRVPFSKEELGELINLFCGMRRTTELCNSILAGAHLGEGKALKLELEKSHEKLLPLDADVNRKIVSAIIKDDATNIQTAAANLLTLKIKTGAGTSISKTCTILETPENIEFLSWAVKLLVSGDELTSRKMRDALQHTPMQPLVNFTMSVRAAIKSGNVLKLATVIDDEIKVCKELGGQAPYERLAALILTMRSVADVQEVRQNIKSNLQGVEDISKIAPLLTAKLGESNKAAAVFVENYRSDIIRLYSVDLNDYWGYEKIVNRHRALLAQQINFLEHPEAWRGMKPSDLFRNAHLIYGAPGVGKSFLVVCMCNTLGIPLVRISREEMSSTYGTAKAEAKQYEASTVIAGKADERIEAKLTKFIREKISQAQLEMRKSSKNFCALFMDEIEGDMVEREVVKGSPEQIALTNAMLRVMEREIASHPEIIFLAATNHIELVDKAAYRLGRFGVHIHLAGPSLEDVKTIMNKALAIHGVKMYEGEPSAEFDKVASEAVGMNPLPLKLAINSLCVTKRIEAIAAKKETIEISYEDLRSAFHEMQELTAIHIDQEKPQLERNVKEILEALRAISESSSLIASELKNKVH